MSPEKLQGWEAAMYPVEGRRGTVRASVCVCGGGGSFMPWGPAACLFGTTAEQGAWLGRLLPWKPLLPCVASEPALRLWVCGTPSEGPATL